MSSERLNTTAMAHQRLQLNCTARHPSSHRQCGRPSHGSAHRHPRVVASKVPARGLADLGTTIHQQCRGDDPSTATAFAREDPRMICSGAPGSLVGNNDAEP
jgi:hypothetical protein